MAAKTDLPPVPAALADVAQIDGPTCAAAGAISVSTWLDLVRRGEAPQPVLRGNRCTRWRLADVRAWLIERAAQPLHDDAVIAKATHASRAAKRKRETAQARA